jgi:pyruvate dehydrogenase E2 component (dihydrolipoamide acetyltransferase)
MTIEVRIPRLGWSMEEGVFLGWQKKDGDAVTIGDVLYEMEGEKATQDIESVDDGILRIPSDTPKAGTKVTVGTLLGYITEKGEPAPWELGAKTVAPSIVPIETLQVAAPSAPAASPSVRRLARQLGVSIESVAGSGPAGRISTHDIQAASSTGQRAATPTTKAVASPRARRIASELGVDWTRLNGTGRDGRIREADVRNASRQSPAPVLPGKPAQAEIGVPERSTESRTPPDAGRTVPLTTRRRTIARRMRASLEQTAPVTLTSRVDATALLSLRRQFKAMASAVVPALTDIIARLAARTLTRHPLLAARWSDDQLILPEDDGYHIGIAVDTEDGLIVAVLRDVLHQSLPQVAEASRELIERARANKASAGELEGGVFTITNLGPLGIDAFTPIINLPETAILGLGAIRREPVVVEGDRIEPRDQMTLSLTFDHRIIDGAPAARFLADLRQAIENPAAALIG